MSSAISSRIVRMVTAKKYIIHKYFDGVPKREDLKLVEEELPPIKDGEFLAEATYLSVDPYMRAYNQRLQLGDTMLGGQVAKITESKADKFPVGRYVVGYFGWRSHTIRSTAESDGSNLSNPYQLLPDFGGLSVSLGLGVLGMTGNSAYFGFLEICQPKEGETVVVSGAAGAVGSHVGQIAKIKGCKVIGIAGDDLKGKWMVEELGFDHFINYKKDKITRKLSEYASNGVDCYFDNVGGDISAAVISKMNDFGRISVCGSITTYNNKLGDIPKSITIQPLLVTKQLKMEGFLVTRWTNRFHEGINQNLQWIKEGKLKYRETVTNGFENMFQAFVEMLNGNNIGKAVVKV